MTRRIHIVGSSPRTGTTLLAELMQHGFAIDGTLDHERSVFEDPPEPCAVSLSKNPGDVLVARCALAADPHLWILHLVRDPRDVVVSRHGRAPDRYWTHLGIWHRYRRAARRTEGHPRFLTVRYEDLVAVPDRVQDGIAAFLPFLRRRRRFSEVHQVARPSSDALDALGGIRPVTTRGVGAWREHRPRVLAQIQRHGGVDRDLVELGYERDSSWKRELEGVTPDDGQTALRQRVRPRRRLRAWRRRRRELRDWRRRLGERPRVADAGPFQIEGLRLSSALIEIGSLGEGDPVVYLPGLGGAATEHAPPLATALVAAGYRCVAVNPRGVGASQGPLDGIELGDLASDVAEVIARVGSPAHVVGRAFGNRVARCLAATHPERVRSVTLLAAGGLVPPEPGALGKKLSARTWKAAARAQSRANAATPVESWWHGGKAPLLVVQGLEDRIAVPENGRRLAAEHPDRVRLLEIDGAGHDLLGDRPDRVIPAIVDFLREVDAAGARS